MVLHRLEFYVLAVNHGGRLYVDFHCLADAETGLESQLATHRHLHLLLLSVHTHEGEVGDAGELEAAQGLVVLCHLTLALEDVNLNGGLAVRSGGEDRFPWGGVSSAVYGGGKRFCQVTHLEAAGEDITFHWEDWQKTITLAGKLWGGFDDDDQLYRQLSDLNIPDDSAIGASWETETGGGFCRVSYSVTMIQSKPSHVNFTIVFYESRQEYCQMMKEAMQNREANRIDQLVLMGQAKQGN